MQKKEIQDIYPLSPIQELTLVYSLGVQKEDASFEQLEFRLIGEINVPKLKQAWSTVISRHSSLRTSFVWDELPNPLQVVHKNVSSIFTDVDWRHLSPIEQTKNLSTYLQADRNKGFDLTKAPLSRLKLCQLSNDCHILVWSLHHLIFDGWSIGIVLEEVFTIYDALCRDQILDLPAVPTYGQYIAWRQKQNIERTESFWRKTLKDFNKPTPLPNKGAFETVGGKLLEEKRFRIKSETTVALKQLAQKQKITLNIILQAVWALVLSRYSQKSDVVYGVTLSGRPVNLPQVEATVGSFINNLPLRIKLNERTSVIGFLKQLQKQNIELLEHQYAALPQIQQWRDATNNSPLFESLFVYQNYPYEGVNGKRYGHLTISRQTQQGPTIRTNYPLTIVGSLTQSLNIRLVYNRQLFRDDGMKELQENMVKFLDALARDPHQFLSELQLDHPPSAHDFQSLEKVRASALRPVLSPPRTPIEKTLAKIWSDLLNVQNVGTTDNFFELGGHSLVVIQLITRLNTLFRIHLPLRHIFEGPTIEQLAIAILQEQMKQMGKQKSQALVEQVGITVK